MNAAEWIDTIVVVVGGIAAIYFGKQQNDIFREQNRIFAAQAGIKMPESPRNKFRLYWPALVAAVIAIGVGAVVARLQISLPKPVSALALGVPWGLVVMLAFVTVYLGKRRGSALPELSQGSGELLLSPPAPSGVVTPEHNVQCTGFTMLKDGDFITATLGFRNVPNGKLLGKFGQPRLRVIYYVHSTGEEIADVYPVEWWSDSGTPIDIGSQELYAVVASFFHEHGTWKAVEEEYDPETLSHSISSKQLPTGTLHIVASLSSFTGHRIPPVEGILTLGEDGSATFQSTKGYIEAI